MGVEEGCGRETCGNSSNLAVYETVIEAPSSKVEGGENSSNGEDGKVEVSRVSQVVVAVETKVALVEGKVDGVDSLQEATVVNGGGVSKGGEKWEGEKVCRICHLEPDLELGDTELNQLIQLGCGCKGELGVAHRQCAEAWFKLKGDRFCEICSEIAVNVTGVIERGVVQEWNERRRAADANTGANNTPETSCWRGHPFCNFLLACLVITFVLPWFFRVSMF